jgi:hypothetical protein
MFVRMGRTRRSTYWIYSQISDLAQKSLKVTNILAYLPPTPVGDEENFKLPQSQLTCSINSALGLTRQFRKNHFETPGKFNW